MNSSSSIYLNGLLGLDNKDDNNDVFAMTRLTNT
jgi:hypothetical protein